MMIKLEEG